MMNEYFRTLTHFLESCQFNSESVIYLKPLRYAVKKGQTKISEKEEKVIFLKKDQKHAIVVVSQRALKDC